MRAQTSVMALLLLSRPVHWEQSLLHIKETHACQKIHRSEGEIPLGGTWLRMETAGIHSQPPRQVKEAEDGL